MKKALIILGLMGAVDLWSYRIFRCEPILPTSNMLDLIREDSVKLHGYVYFLKHPDSIRADTFPDFPSSSEWIGWDPSAGRVCFRVNADSENLPKSKNVGDTCIFVIMTERFSGTLNHVGYYAVINDTFTGATEDFTNPCSLRVMPYPVVVETKPNCVKLAWKKAKVDSGTPPMKLVEGYQVWRSEDGINFSILCTLVTDTFYVDSITYGTKKYFYALKIVFAGKNATWYLSRATSVKPKYDAGVVEKIEPAKWVEEDDTIYPSVIIENEGFDTTETIFVYIRIDSNSVVVYNDTVKIAHLPPNSIDTVTCDKSWVPGIQGKEFNFVCYVVTDSDGYVYNDTLKDTVRTYFHDLNAINIEFREEQYWDLQDTLLRPYFPTRLWVFVMNEGNAPEENYIVEIWVDSDTVNVFYKADTQHSPLTPGDTAEVWFDGWSTGAPHITYTFRGKVTSLRDKVNDNDTVSWRAKTIALDVEIDSIIFPSPDGSDSLEPDTIHRPRIKVKNNSKIVLYRLWIKTIYKFDTVMHTIDSTLAGDKIYPDASIEVVCKKWDPKNIGGKEFNLTFINLTRGDTFNHNDTASVNFYTYLHDLCITRIIFPDTVYPGLSYIPYCVIYNRGDKTESNIKVFCTVNKETLEAVYYDTITISSLAKNDSSLCEFAPWQAGNDRKYRVAFRLIHDKDLVYTNNQMSKYVFNLLHDISVDSIFIPDTCIIDSSYLPFVKLSNKGNFTEYQIKAVASILYGKDEVYRDSVLINELPIGGIFTHFFKEFVPNNRGDYILVTKVDYDDNWTLNNTLTKSFVAIEYGIEEPLSTYSVKIMGENPAINSMSLIYTLPEKSMVKIYLVDVCGRLVKMLENSEKDKGRYTIKLFNLPAGIYYCVFKLGDKKFIKKVIFIK